MIKYRTGFAGQIEEIEIIRETAESVFRASFYMRGNPTERELAKRSKHENYHDTWADAHQFLIDRATAKVASARRRLEFTNCELGNIKGMKAPEVAA